MFSPPVVSAHNLIIGTIYIDVSGKCSLVNLDKKGERCDMELFLRGWSWKNAFKVVGDVKN